MEVVFHSAESRGKGEHGWLNSRHSFSFAEYYDPNRMGFGALRVINDDWIAPAQGFGTHPHRDMEIITVPLSGALQHRDSTGGSGIIRKGEVQVMSAGTGIRHSEFNASSTEPCELLQIWVIPEKFGIKPRYDQKQFPIESRKNRYQCLVSPDAREGSLVIHQRAFFFLANISQNFELSYHLADARNGAYFFLIAGAAIINGKNLTARDALGIAGLTEISVKASQDSELLVMEIPF